MAAEISETTGKRKRARISYVEPEDDFDELEEDTVTEAFYKGDVDPSDDDDVTYGSRKKVTKTNGRSKKIRLTLPKPKRKGPEKHFRFLDLPAELRDMIYEMALVEPAGITLVNRTKALRRTVARGKINNEGGGHRYRRRYYWGRRHLNTNADTQSEPQVNPHLIPNLLAVNRQIHDEAVGYLYMQPFILEDTMALHAFIAGIGPANRLFLSEITVRSWGESRGAHKTMNFASLTALAGCTNLNRLFLDDNVGWRRSPSWLAKQIYRDGHYFLEAFGAANGRRDAAIDILEFKECNYEWYSSRYNREVQKDAEIFKKEFRAQMQRLLH